MEASSAAEVAETQQGWWSCNTTLSLSSVDDVSRSFVFIQYSFVILIFSLM